jgi:hypothetical protein
VGKDEEKRMSQPHRGWPQPIPTRYDGYHFRSKNEARWAAFFKKLGVPYRYEVDRYQVNGGTYLIDFEFQEQEEKGITDCLVEIKPKEPTAEECTKAEWLAQTRGIPVYIFYGDQRCPSEKNGAQGILYQVRSAWLVYEGQRLPLALHISNEARVALLKLHEAGFRFQCTYQHNFPSTLLVGPRPKNSQLLTPQQMLNQVQNLKDVEDELLEVATETIKQFLRGPHCEKYVGGHTYLTCGGGGWWEGCEEGDCLREECQSARQLQGMLKRRRQEEKPCSFHIEFDESRSSEEHYWAQCTDCHAIGIFPGSFKHDLSCSIHGRETDNGWQAYLEEATFATEEEYRMAHRQLVDVEAKAIQEAYMAAREEQFRKKTR